MPKNHVPVCWLLMLSFTILGCDGAIEVEGKLLSSERTNDIQECELDIVRMIGPIWGEETPKKYRSQRINNTFHVNFSIGGPTDSHWVEISCPNYVTYRSEPFQAPSKNRKVNLGEIVLQKIKKARTKDGKMKKRGSLDSVL